MDDARDLEQLAELQQELLEVIGAPEVPILPDLESLEKCCNSLHTTLPYDGIGLTNVKNHLLKEVAPGLNQATLSSRYYGFVTGGITPAARLGESVVSTYDQNVQVHLPDQTIATLVEAKSLDLLLDLLRFESRVWSGVFTTGATGGNIMGLALAREYVVNKALKRVTGQMNTDTVGQCGLLHACQLANIKGFRILTTKPHSSLVKAASILGFGRGSVVDVPTGDDDLTFDLASLEAAMATDSHDHGIIVVVSCGEVNTGLFSTDGDETMQNLRTLSDRYGAWLHVDGAFGVFARVLDGLPGLEKVARGAAGLELADSVAGDGHKMLNVPYDCGFFLHRQPGLAEQVFQNANAAYLNNSTVSPDAIRSPLNIGIENSRRFRALPVYATLVSYGRKGYQDMVLRQVRLARAVASLIFRHPAFELLPSAIGQDETRIEQDVFIVVLFKAKDDRLNAELSQRINATSMIYVSGTTWCGTKASRIAVANWQARWNRDLPVIEKVLNKVAQDWETSTATK